METREFWGRDMNEALQAVRNSLGADALILETLCMPGAEGSEGEERIKVTAMPTNEEREAVSSKASLRKKPDDYREHDASRRVHSSRSVKQEDLEVRGWREVSAHLKDLRTMLYWLLPEMKMSRVLGELVEQDVAPELLTRLLQEVDGDGDDERTLLRRAIQRLIFVGGDVETLTDSPTYLAFIGPPGVGKTSAIVKLTVHLMRKDDRKIGWVTTDNRRVVGADELAVYAGILGVPCEVAEGGEGLTRALERLPGCNLIFIDTPGVSPRDAAGMSELAGVLQNESLPSIRRSLVLNATTNGRDLTLWTQRYRRVGYDSLLFSMIDACGSFGSLLNAVVSCDRPLSYLTTSASVTQGISVASPEAIVDLLLP